MTKVEKAVGVITLTLTAVLIVINIGLVKEMASLNQKAGNFEGVLRRWNMLENPKPKA